MKILAVDDDETALEILKIALINAKYSDVTVARSAYEAMDIIEKHGETFDCFIFDISMPGMSGIELCQTVRNSARHAGIPIIMITALSDQCNIDQAFAAGATDYVTKPFNDLS